MGSQFDGLYSCGNCGYGIYARLLYDSKEWEFYDNKDRNKDLDSVTCASTCPRCKVELTPTTVAGIPDLKKDEPEESKESETDSESKTTESAEEAPKEADKVIVERIVETDRLGKSWGHIFLIFLAMVVVSIVSIIIDRQFRGEKIIYVPAKQEKTVEPDNSSATNPDDTNTSPTGRKIDLKKDDGASVIKPVENEIDPLKIELVATYPLNGSARDSSGKNLHASIVGAKPVKDRFGMEKSALAFDGIKDHVKLPAFEVGEDMTISIWCKFLSFNYMSRLVDLGNGSVYDNIVLCNERRTAQLSFYIYKLDPETSRLELKKLISPQTYKKDEWIHVAGTISKEGILKFFINGEKIKEEKSDWVPENLKRTFQYTAKSNWPDDEFFHGELDDLRIWNRELTEEEITQIAKSNSVVAGI